MSWHKVWSVSVAAKTGEEETRDIRHIRPGKKVLGLVFGETKTNNDVRGTLVNRKR